MPRPDSRPLLSVLAALSLCLTLVDRANAEVDWVGGFAGRPVIAGAAPPRSAVSTSCFDSVAVAGARESAGSAFLLSGAMASALECAGEHTWRPLGLPGFLATSLIVDPVRDRLIAYGGHDAHGRKIGTVWTRSLSTLEPWTRLVVDGPAPAPRMNHSAIYDPLRDRMIIYGGWPQGTTGSREVWALDFAGTPRWTDLTPVNTGPGDRIGAQMAYDPEHDRLIVVGGHPSDNVAFPSDVWTLDLSHPAEWVNASPPEPWPPPREDGVMIYDQARHRMILFGGCPGSLGMGAHADVWALSLGATIAWQQIQPQGEAILGLHSFAAALDPARERLLIFSGRDSLCSDAPRPECWALQLDEPPRWIRVETSAPQPSPRYFSRAAYDRERDRMVLFGGTSDDLWLLGFASAPAWTEVDRASGGVPYGLHGASAAYDAHSRHTYLFGGASGYYVHGSFYPFASGEFFGATLGAHSRWQSVIRDGPPGPRYGHSLMADPIGNRLLLWGGTSDGARDSTVWQLPLEGALPWSRLETAGSAPGPRSFHSAVYDSRRRRLLVFGGLGPSGSLGELWALSLDGAPAWTRIEADGIRPLARSGHVAVYDSLTDRMVLFGGEIGSVPVDDTWQLSLSSTPHWTPVPTPIRPPARAMAAAVCDRLRKRIVMIGGKGASAAPLSDLWTFDLTGADGWAPAAMAGPNPAARWGAAAAFDEGEDLLLLLGGTRSTDPQAFDSNTWLMSSTVPVVTALSKPTVQVHPGRVSLVWTVPAGPYEDAIVQRQSAFEEWASLDEAVTWRDDHARFEDMTATPGARLAYRLRWRAANTVRVSGLTWVDVPSLRLALLTAKPNPSPGPLTVEFSLPDASPARLELLDIAGRRLWQQPIGHFGAGDHSIVIDRTANLRAGIYLVRLVRKGESRTARVGVVR